MEYLLTKCPNCRAGFYEEVNSEKELEIRCPYCNFRYEDEIEEDRIKEASYFWELYRNLYPSNRINLGNEKGLQFGGWLMISTIPIFFYYFSKLNPNEINFIFGLGLAGIIFFGFILGGAISFLKKYSFAVSVTGAFFGALNSILWLFVSGYSNASLITFPYMRLLFYFALIVSFISLSLGIHNRWTFRIN